LIIFNGGTNLKQRNVGILMFNEIEVLDFAGPFEVFSLTTIPQQDKKPFVVKTVSQTGNMVMARNGLKIQPDYSFENASEFDILVIPGGYGAEQIEIHNDILIEWIKSRANGVELMTSVCTGAFLLAKAGLLDEKRATTHWMDIDRLEKEFPKVIVKRDVKFVEEGAIITSGGISAGINMCFHIVEKLLGKEIAQATAKRMEYEIMI